MRAPALFALDRADLLATLADELDACTYAPSKGRAFAITDPKSRLIYALPFRDRVVQHWLMERMMPAMERWFAPQSYACRVGKGSHRCLERAIELTRHKRFVLRIDIRKFFPSIDHAILRALLEPFTADHLRSVGPMPHLPKQNGIGWLCDAFLEQRVECERVAWYFPGDTLFTPFDRPHGLPIGSLTSQIWANAFLTPIDHLIASKLRIGTFVRYCDDLLLFDDDKGRLQDALSAIEQRATAMRLRLHPGKTRLHRSTDPVGFLGFVLRQRPDGGVSVRLQSENILRFRRRMQETQQLYEAGAIEARDVVCRVRAWLAHAQHGDTRALCKQELARLAWVRST